MGQGFLGKGQHEPKKKSAEARTQEPGAMGHMRRDLWGAGLSCRVTVMGNCLVTGTEPFCPGVESWASTHHQDLPTGLRRN